MAYPTSIDAYVDWIDGTSVVEAFTINDIHATLATLQAKVGIDSSPVTTSHDYKLTNMPNPTVNGSIDTVFTKYLTDTLGAGSSINIAHGISGIDNILAISISVFNGSSGEYTVYEQFNSGSGAISLTVSYDGTNIILSGIGSNLQGQKYRIKVNYI